MTFTEALDAAFKDGERVTRTAWGNRNIFVSAVEGKLCITGFSSNSPDDGKAHPLIIVEADYFPDDWEVVE